MLKSPMYPLPLELAAKWRWPLNKGEQYLLVRRWHLSNHVPNDLRWWVSCDLSPNDYIRAASSCLRSNIWLHDKGCRGEVYFFLLLAFFLSFSIISDKFELKWLHCDWNIKSIMTSSERFCQTNWSDYLFCDQILLTLISRGSTNKVMNVAIESAISLQILYHYLCRDWIDNGCATNATMLWFLLLYHCIVCMCSSI